MEEVARLPQQYLSVTYTPGQLELGSDGNVYGNFNGNRIQLSLPKQSIRL